MEKSKEQEEYISVEFFMNELKMPIRGSTTVKSVYSNLESYVSVFNFNVVTFSKKESFQDGNKSKYGVSKSFLELLKKEYTSLEKVTEDISYTSLNKALRKHKLEVIKLQQTVKTGMFIKIEDINNMPEYISIVKLKKLSVDKNYLTKREVYESLGISTTTMDTVIKDYNVDYEKVSGEMFFTKSTLFFLKEEQLKAQQLLDNYYLGSEMRKVTGSSSTREEFREKFEWIPCPTILSIPNPADKSGYLWKKADVHAYLDEKSKREIAKIELDTPYETYIYRLSYLDIELSSHPVTQALWLQYVKERLSYDGAKVRTKFRYIGNLLEVTKTLFTSLSSELYKMSSSEINFSLLNDNVEVSHRFILYLFIKRIYVSFKEQGKITNYEIRKLKNPFSNYQPEERDSSIYSIDHYQKLFDFAQNVAYHKIRAIDETINFLNTGKTNSYCSVWVYVITHLSNNWRHSTVITELPRLNLTRIRAQSFEWLKENDLTMLEAKDIIYQIGRHTININKTGAEGYFTISESMTIPFATAAVICELRLRALGEENGSLISIPSDKTVNSRANNSFFYSFLDDTFKFENRKMNRSLTTYIWSIISHFTNEKDEALLASQFSRMHYTDSSTNIYIKLTQKQIDNLSEQLFSRNQFGFVYKLFSDLLLGEAENKSLETTNIELIQKEFGDIFKVEATAGLINKVSERQLEAKAFINNLSIDDLQQMYTLLLANLLPAKEKHYQCIKKECIYEELNCRDCPISIPNVYSLSNSLDIYVKQIENLHHFEDLPIGEKMRQANQFFIIRKQIEEARIKFGKDMVYTFLPGGKERLSKLQKLLPAKKTVSQHTTINIGR